MVVVSWLSRHSLQRAQRPRLSHRPSADLVHREVREETDRSGDEGRVYLRLWDALLPREIEGTQHCHSRVRRPAHKQARVRRRARSEIPQEVSGLVFDPRVVVRLKR